MEATSAPPTPIARQATVFSGDIFYGVARLAVLALLLSTANLQTGEPLWPLTDVQSTLGRLIWAYGVFTLLALAAIPLRQQRAGRVALVIDVVFFTLLTFFNTTVHDLFYPLYIIPLVGASIQLRRRNGLAVGVLAAVGYGLAFLLSYATDAERSVARDTLGLLALMLRCAVLVFVPWLAGGLAERYSTTNRRTVELAEEKRQQALAEAQAYRDRSRALYEVAYTLSSSTTNQSILNTTLSEGRKLAPYSCGAALLATGNPDELFVAAGLGLAPDDHTRTVQLGSGPISTALHEAEPFVVDNMAVEPLFTPLTALARERAACVIPLRSGLHSYGALVLAAGSPDAFTEERVGMLAALANYALVALQNAQLIGDLRGERSKLLSKEEEVRHQLARDLHDGPAQALAAITMNVEFIKRLFDRDPARVIPELDKLGSLARRTTHEVRTMLFELRPLALETQGLAQTLQQYFERFQNEATKIILEAESISVDLDTKTEGTLFNIIQESVNNAIKHARAEHIWVRLKMIPEGLEATVQDDGRGFDLAKVRESYEKRGSFGLLNIEERAQLVGGKAELRSAPGEGTTVRVVVPVS